MSATPFRQNARASTSKCGSDHYFPWLSSQGHAPYAWSVLGAVAHATDRVELFTYVTCPTMRYHPAVVAQQAATLQILADGRFTDIALVQIGDESQEVFLKEAAGSLLEKLRSESH